MKTGLSKGTFTDHLHRVLGWQSVYTEQNNGVQEVAGSNPVGPIYLEIRRLQRESPTVFPLQ
jgi:hypothetical protein